MRHQEGEEGGGSRHVSEVPPETLQYLEEVGGWALQAQEEAVHAGGTCGVLGCGWVTDSSNDEAQLVGDPHSCPRFPPHFPPTQIVSHFKTLTEGEEKQLLVGNVLEELKGKEAQVKGEGMEEGDGVQHSYGFTMMT